MDEDGNPMVVYHGTNKDFTVFDRAKIGSQTDDGVYGSGFYFSSNKGQAEQYGNVKEYYLSLQNPLRLNDYENIETLADHLDMVESNFSKSNGIIRPIYNAVNRFTSHVMEKGYDGVIVDYGTADEIVVFDPAQIKSATDNIGTFDRANPDIRYSLSDDETRTSSRVYDAYQHDMEFYGELLANQNLQEAASIAQKMHDMMVRGDSYLTKETREKGLVPEAAWKENARRAVEKVKSETGSQMSDRTLTAEINRIYKYLNRPDASVSEAVMYARDLSKRVLDKVAMTDVEEDGGVTEIKRTLRESRFYLTEDQKDAIREEYGSVKAYTQKNFGKLAIRAKAKDGKRGANQTLADKKRRTYCPSFYLIAYRMITGACRQACRFSDAHLMGG